MQAVIWSTPVALFLLVYFSYGPRSYAGYGTMLAIILTAMPAVLSPVFGFFSFMQLRQSSQVFQRPPLLAFISPKRGLVFFASDGVFIENPGEMKRYDGAVLVLTRLVHLPQQRALELSWLQTLGEGQGRTLSELIALPREVGEADVTSLLNDIAQARAGASTQSTS